MATSERFFVLEGIRGVCALLVVLRHAEAIVFGVNFYAPLTYLAVDMFFLLSGFVLAHAYEERLRAGTLSVGGFMKLRFVRLYPMYILGTCLTGAMYLLLGVDPWVRLGMGAVGIPLFSAREPMFPLNMPAWSLFYEVIIGLVYAWCVVKLSNRHLLLLTAGLFALLCVWLVRLHGLNFGAISPEMVPGFVKVGYSFFAGVLVYRFKDRIRVKMPGSIGLMSVLALVLGVGVPCLLLVPPGAFEPLLVGILMLVVFPATVFLAAKVTVAHRHLVSLFLLLGSISYPVYALHYAVFPFVNYLHLSKHDITISNGAYLLILVEVLVLMAFVVEMVVDKPVRRRFGAWLGCK